MVFTSTKRRRARIMRYVRKGDFDALPLMVRWRLHDNTMPGSGLRALWLSWLFSRIGRSAYIGCIAFFVIAGFVIAVVGTQTGFSYTVALLCFVGAVVCAVIWASCAYLQKQLPRSELRVAEQFLDDVEWLIDFLDHGLAYFRDVGDSAEDRILTTDWQEFSRDFFRLEPQIARYVYCLDVMVPVGRAFVDSPTEGKIYQICEEVLRIDDRHRSARDAALHFQIISPIDHGELANQCGAAIRPVCDRYESGQFDRVAPGDEQHSKPAGSHMSADLVDDEGNA